MLILHGLNTNAAPSFHANDLLNFTEPESWLGKAESKQVLLNYSLQLLGAVLQFPALKSRQWACFPASIPTLPYVSLPASAHLYGLPCLSAASSHATRRGTRGPAMAPHLRHIDTLDASATSLFPGSEVPPCQRRPTHTPFRICPRAAVAPAPIDCTQCTPDPFWASRPSGPGPTPATLVCQGPGPARGRLRKEPPIRAEPPPPACRRRAHGTATAGAALKQRLAPGNGAGAL